MYDMSIGSYSRRDSGMEMPQMQCVCMRKEFRQLSTVSQQYPQCKETLQFHARFTCVACYDPLIRIMAANFGFDATKSNAGSRANILKLTPGGMFAMSGKMLSHQKSSNHEYAWACYQIFTGNASEVADDKREQIARHINTPLLAKFIQANSACVVGYDLEGARSYARPDAAAQPVGGEQVAPDGVPVPDDLKVTVSAINVAQQTVHALHPASVYEAQMRGQARIWGTPPERAPGEGFDQRKCRKIARMLSMGLCVEDVKRMTSKPVMVGCTGHLPTGFEAPTSAKMDGWSRGKLALDVLLYTVFTDPTKSFKQESKLGRILQSHGVYTDDDGTDHIRDHTGTGMFLTLLFATLSDPFMDIPNLKSNKRAATWLEFCKSVFNVELDGGGANIKGVASLYKNLLADMPDLDNPWGDDHRIQRVFANWLKGVPWLLQLVNIALNVIRFVQSPKRWREVQKIAGELNFRLPDFSVPGVTRYVTHLRDQLAKFMDNIWFWVICLEKLLEPARNIFPKQIAKKAISSVKVSGWLKKIKSFNFLVSISYFLDCCESLAYLTNLNQGITDIFTADKTREDFSNMVKSLSYVNGTPRVTRLEKCCVRIPTGSLVVRCEYNDPELNTSMKPIEVQNVDEGVNNWPKLMMTSTSQLQKVVAERYPRCEVQKAWRCLFDTQTWNWREMERNPCYLSQHCKLIVRQYLPGYSNMFDVHEGPDLSDIPVASPEECVNNSHAYSERDIRGSDSEEEDEEVDFFAVGEPDIIETAEVDEREPSYRLPVWMIENLEQQVIELQKQLVALKKELKPKAGHYKQFWETVFFCSRVSGVSIVKYFYMIGLARGKSTSTIEGFNKLLKRILDGADSGGSGQLEWREDQLRVSCNGPKPELFDGYKYITEGYFATCGLTRVRSVAEMQLTSAAEAKRTKHNDRSRRYYQKHKAKIAAGKQASRDSAAVAKQASRGEFASLPKTRVRKKKKQAPPSVVSSGERHGLHSFSALLDTDAHVGRDAAFKPSTDLSEEIARGATRVQAWKTYEEETAAAAVASTKGKRTRDRSRSPSIER